LYLWGYVAEMILKAAFFEVRGFAENQPIIRRDLQNALATLPGIGGNPPLHHLSLWARALVAYRASTPGLGYADPAFASQVTAKAQALYGLWRETLRYHKNVAYPHEIDQARAAAEWLLTHSSKL
jgi:hypothetical protein